MRNVEVSPYMKHWAVMFEEEARELRSIFGEQLIDIHHIGSTSVPGLQAKQTIDMMPVVKEISLVDEYNPAMIDIGYMPRGENGIVGRRYFHKGGDTRTHHVHIYQLGHPDIERHVAFRDYLRSHSEVAKAYGDLKTHLAREFPYDIHSYVRRKESLVLEIERDALKWYRENNSN